MRFIDVFESQCEVRRRQVLFVEAAVRHVGQQRVDGISVKGSRRLEIDISFAHMLLGCLV